MLDPVGNNGMAGADGKDERAQTLIMRADMACGRQCHIRVCGHGRFGSVVVCGHGRFGRYSYADADVITERTVLEIRTTWSHFLVGKKEHFIFIHSLHMPITTVLW